MSALQWGHGSEAVETEDVAPPHRLVFILQWGHGSEAVETFGWVEDFEGFLSLQWGHGSEAVETHGLGVTRSRPLFPSMGPRL
ncbi:protein of unknown function [Candidatus Methylomirabilis oxygeniifera]|uniref:Uncharacterized protein n=1 Tax=Methylomirabilis oxygeniifera TaxID=671143 RepID=D5MKW1_METO1|nr:protein of unknown function [Candidatus Methylomirabilis oxyfera]